MARFGAAVKASALAGVVVLLLASPALAVIEVDPKVQEAYNGCVGQMRGSGTDGVLRELEQSTKRIKVRHPVIFGESDTTTYLPGSDVQINWVPENDGRKLPSEGGPDFTEDQCATLIHEMTHAADRARGTDRGTFCYGSDGTPTSDVNPSEVHAVVMENAYRRAVGLPERTMYSRTKLPVGGEDCAPPAPERPRGGCSTSAVGANYRCANTNGDPHLTTFDGLRYDFQAAGEFVLARSSGGDFEVQVRQTMFPGSTVASVNSAVAANVAGDRVGVYATPDGLSLRVNGAEKPAVPGESRLPKGGTISVDADGAALVTWPDRAVLHAVPIGAWGMSVSVGAPGTRAGTMTGLLGDDDGDPADDLVASGGGRPLAQPPPFADLYPGYADSWRIPADRSLFDYEPGQSTATFTDRRFPTNPVNAADLPNRATAELVCRQAGVTDQQALDACVLDVGITGQPAFAGDAARVQRSRSAPGDVTLEVTQAGATASTAFAATAGQKVFVEIPTATLGDRCGIVTLVDPQGTQFADGCVVDGRGFIDATVLPVAGEYKVVLDPYEKETGRATIRVITAVDQNLTGAADGSVVKATLGQPGAVSRLAFHGSAGQKVFTEVTGSSLPDRCGVLKLHGPAGDTLASGCVIGGQGFVDSVVLPAAGTYVLEVDGEATDIGFADLRVVTDVDQQQDTTPDGRPVTMAVEQPGAVSRLRFTGSAGKRLVVEVTGVSRLPDRCGVLTLTGPDGATVGTGCVIYGAGRIEVPALPSAGTYQLLLDPYATDTGTAAVTVRQTG